MTSAETNKLQWKTDPLLTGKRHKAAFAQTSWDQTKERKFGTWSPEHVAQTRKPASPNEPETPENYEQSGPQAEPDKPADPKAAANGTESPGSSNPGPNTHTATDSASADKVAAKSELNEQHLLIARQQGYVQGLKDGMTKALHDLETERAKERELIQTITSELEALKNEATRLHEPLRKLALHIAEQLVRGELSTSAEAVERLVRACLADVNGQEQGINVSLNPNDLERVRPLLKNNEPALNLQPDMGLLPGSVRVRSNDTVIEDLIENRLEGLARQLLSEPETWLKNASRLAGTQVESVAPSFADRKKTAMASDIDDVPEKVAPKAAQDIEEVHDVEAVQASEEVNDIDEVQDIEEVRAPTPSPETSVQSPPVAHEGDQPYL